MTHLVDANMYHRPQVYTYKASMDCSFWHQC